MKKLLEKLDRFIYPLLVRQMKNIKTIARAIFILIAFPATIIYLIFFVHESLKTRELLSPVPKIIDATPISGHDINQYRMLNGLKELKFSEELYLSASEKAQAIFLDRSKFKHDGYKDQILKYYRHYDTIGENLAQYFLSPEEVFAAWKNSPEHNKVMLNPNVCEYGFAEFNDVYVLHVGCK